jgi:ABC-type polysaccharide/polyol phosphate export permease
VSQRKSDARFWSGDLLLLLQVMIEKDFKIRYRSMSLGILWSVLNPLVNLSILAFVFAAVFPNKQIQHFPVYLLAGIVPWNFMVSTLLGGSSCLVDNAAMMRRVAFPREVIPLGTILSMAPHAAINVALLALASASLGLTPSWPWLWLILIWIVFLALFCGLAFLLSPVSVLVRDMRYVIDALVALNFWLVPIFYEESQVAEQWRGLYGLNPTTLVTQLHRAVLIRGEIDSARLLTLAAEAAIVCALGWWHFRSMQRQVNAYL